MNPIIANNKPAKVTLKMAKNIFFVLAGGLVISHFATALMRAQNLNLKHSRPVRTVKLIYANANIRLMRLFVMAAISSLMLVLSARRVPSRQEEKAIYRLLIPHQKNRLWLLFMTLPKMVYPKWVIMVQ